jgi:uncharacterized membrane protein
MRAFLTALIIVTACEPASDETDEPETPVESGCGEDIPILTWEGFGRGFMVTYCQGCHATTAPDRHDAPPNVVFDTEADVALWKDRIIATAGGEPATMPPAGGPTPEDREKLAAWLGCMDE